MSLHLSVHNYLSCLITLLLTLFSASLHAKESEDGFSYFLGIGQQQIRFEERPSIIPVQTETDITNPIIITGALYRVHDDVLFSLDAESTFAPDTVKEKWFATENPFYNQSLSDNLLQTNSFSFQQNTTRILLHYRLTDQWFFIAGPSLRTQTFKRFGFKAGPDNAVTAPENQVVEESASEIILQAGIALESVRIVHKPIHYSARLSAGKPAWREVTNTLIPDATFTDTGGLDITFEGRVSVALHSHVHVGGWLQWGLLERDSESTCVADPTPDLPGDVTNSCDARNPALTIAELPESEIRQVGYGIELLWKL